MTSSELICACDDIVHPRVVFNPPGRDLIDYRVGDFRSFRHALLRPRDGEIALAGWHPTAEGDLALQLLEWWAYLADVLVFYNERAVHEVLLRTAMPEDVRRLVRLLGYRPRPGIGATGVVAALTSSTQPFVVPRGFAIDGVPPPEGSPQIFEVDLDVKMGQAGQKLPRSARMPEGPGLADTASPKPLTNDRGFLVDSTTVTAHVPPVTVESDVPFSLGLEGVVASVKPGDMLVLLSRDWDGAGHGEYALSIVESVTHGWDPTGKAVTTVVMRSGRSLPRAAAAAHYRLLRPTKQAHLWLYHERFSESNDIGKVSAGLAMAAVAGVAESILDPLHLFSSGMSSTPPQDPRALCGISLTDPSQGVAHLEAITRGINAGDPVLFEQRLTGQTQLVKVLGYAEDIWYANPPESDRIGQGPPVGPPGSHLIGGGASPLPIPTTRLTFAPEPLLEVMIENGTALKTIVCHYAWQEVASIVETPPRGPVDASTPDSTNDLPAGHPVLVEDANGNGIPGFIGEPSTHTDRPLVLPLRAYTNLLPVSRGQTVSDEVIGSGDPILVRQEFVLSRWPLTYLRDPSPDSIDGYRSTLEIRVDGIRWTEVQSFYDQPPDARVYVTREDEAQRTYVRFGDGENGARLPAGVGNVIARYRVGSGAAVPLPGTLTSMERPIAGLTAIRNPVSVGGGADPDPPDQIRRYAPRSVLTFGRAISGDDYETIAAQTPGVRRARAVWGWNAAAQRSMVKVFVGDDLGAVAAARAALLAYADPNRPVSVALAMPLFPDLTLTVEVDPLYDRDAVQAAVTAALLDPAQLPFGTDVVRIGEPVYDSEIYDACLRVAGVVAVHGLQFALWQRYVIDHRARYRTIPAIYRDDVDPLGTDVSTGLDGFFDRLQRDDGERHTPGEGRFYLLRPDRLHVQSEVARNVL
ncbi:MAG TPA: hypothetical protein VL326_14545 [Kofleriaceae bacterium]|nr:hypothetical protein [Kofleriaceae bacterium]